MGMVTPTLCVMWRVFPALSLKNIGELMLVRSEEFVVRQNTQAAKLTFRHGERDYFVSAPLWREVV